MITLILIGLFISASCVAAAGLIASAQNSVDGAHAMVGIDPPEPQF